MKDILFTYQKHKFWKEISFIASELCELVYNTTYQRDLINLNDILIDHNIDLKRKELREIALILEKSKFGNYEYLGMGKMALRIDKEFIKNNFVVIGEGSFRSIVRMNNNDNT